MSGGGMQGQQGAPMQGGGKGGPQGGMNRGPGGNAQNNPGVASQQMSPGMGAFANYSNMMQGLGSSGVSQMPDQLGPGQVSPQGPAGPTASTWGSRNPMGTPNWAATGGLTPIQNMTAGQPRPMPMLTPMPSSGGWSMPGYNPQDNVLPGTLSAGATQGGGKGGPQGGRR